MQIIATLYDSQNRVIGTKNIFTNPDNIYPGQSAPFELIVGFGDSISIGYIDHVKFHVDWRDAVATVAHSTTLQTTLGQQKGSPAADFITMQVYLRPDENPFNANMGFYQINTWYMNASKGGTLCPSGTCRYSIEKPQFVTNNILAGGHAYLFTGLLQLGVVTNGITNSKFYPMLAELDKTASQEKDGQTTEFLQGSIKFGMDTNDPDFEYRVNNGTLLVNPSAPVLTLQASKLTSAKEATAAAIAAGNQAATTTAATTTNTTSTKIAVRTLIIPMGASVQGKPSYDPNPLTAKKGDIIQVINKDQTPHTVTSGKGMLLLGRDDPDKGKLFDTNIISPGSSAKILTATLNPGGIPFHCELHPYMIGTLVIIP